MTGTLNMRYVRVTPLGDLTSEAWIDRAQGRKTWVVGTISDAEGVCVKAEGLFILPRWAMEEDPQPPRFE